MMPKIDSKKASVSPRKYTFLLLFFLMAGFILRLNNLSERSLWTDEFFTFFESTGHGLDIKNFLGSLSSPNSPKLLMAKELKAFFKLDPGRGLKDVSKGLLYTDTHAPLYFWIIHLWMMIFKDGVLSVRLFSLLMGMISILLAFKVSKYLFTKKAALFSALFMSISAFSVRYAQEARPYALLMVLGLSCWFFILRFQKYNRNLDIICFAIFNCLGFYVHYFYIFSSLSLFAYFTLANYRDKARLDKFYLAFLLSLLFFLPWVMLLISRGYKFYLVEWLFGYPGLINKAYLLMSGMGRYILILDNALAFLRLFSIVGLLIFSYIVIRAGKDILTRHIKSSMFCLTMFLVPLLGMFFMDILEHGILLKQERFWMFPFLGFIPLAGYSIDYGFSKAKTVTCLLLILMCISSFTVSKLQFGPAPKYASLWIEKKSEGGVSAVIVYNIRSVIFAQAYYLDDDTYLMPVLNQEQLDSAVKLAAGFVDKLFIVRHYHHSDVSLMDRGFLEAKELGANFKFQAEIKSDDISVSEFLRCEL
jgi:uncharacterized membrane protein